MLSNDFPPCALTPDSNTERVQSAGLFGVSALRLSSLSNEAVFRSDEVLHFPSCLRRCTTLT